MNKFGLACLVSMLSFQTACMAQQSSQPSVQASMDYVLEQDYECTLDDGYVCREVEEDNFLSADSYKRLIPAVYLDAWAAARQDMLDNTELTAEQKKLMHYKVGFSEDEQSYIVLFNALLLPELINGEPVGVIRSTLGMSTKYWIDKKSMTVARRAYLR